MSGFRLRFPTVTPWTTDRDLPDIVFRACFLNVVTEQGWAGPGGASRGRADELPGIGRRASGPGRWTGSVAARGTFLQVAEGCGGRGVAPLGLWASSDGHAWGPRRGALHSEPRHYLGVLRRRRRHTAELTGMRSLASHNSLRWPRAPRAAPRPFMPAKAARGTGRMTSSVVTREQPGTAEPRADGSRMAGAAPWRPVASTAIASGVGGCCARAFSAWDGSVRAGGGGRVTASVTFP